MKNLKTIKSSDEFSNASRPDIKKKPNELRRYPNQDLNKINSLNSSNANNRSHSQNSSNNSGQF